MKLSALVAPWVKVVLANGSIVQTATVQLFTLNPSSDLYKSAESNPSRVLQQDIDFKTQVLVIGPVVNNQVVGKFYTNSSGIAALDGVNPGIYLVWAYQIYLGYFNLVSYLQPGWNFQMQLKPESAAEPNGPYQNTITSSQPAWIVYAEIGIAVAVFVSLGAWAISLERKRKLKELPAFPNEILCH